MQSATNLRVTAFARVLAGSVYSATTRFPVAERFGLTSQMRRAVISIGSNIAEGCGRSSDRELAQFLHDALGSASELEFQTQVATDLSLLSTETAAPLLNQITQLKKMLACLIRAIRTSRAGPEAVRPLGRPTV